MRFRLKTENFEIEMDGSLEEIKELNACIDYEDEEEDEIYVVLDDDDVNTVSEDFIDLITRENFNYGGTD